MRFTDPDKVFTVINQMKMADIPRSENRANLQRLYNGERPFTDQQAQDNSIQTNVNFLEGTKILHDARQQWNNAFLKTGNFFTVTLSKGDPIKRRGWQSTITSEINRIMKNSAEYMEMFQAVGATVFLNGPSPSRWTDEFKWCPEEIGIDDFLVPSNTLKSFKNLNHFAFYTQYSYGELFKKTHGPHVDKGWNKELVETTLMGIKDIDSEANPAETAWNPEKMAERIKANLGFYDSDAVPVIRAWDFYFHDDEKDHWNRRIVLDTSSQGDGKTKQFLYQRDGFAKDRSEIVHCQFADGANKAPFYYHSVRSLGWLLYDVVRLQNRLRSKFNDAVFEQMLWYFYISSPEDRDRLQQIALSHMGVIPEGMRFVPATERFQPRADLVNMAMSQNRQNMAENSSSFTQEVNDGTQKEMTATETMARVNSASQLVSAMLNLAYGYEKFRYIEIARRFCKKNSTDPDVKKFQEKCRREGAPDEVMNYEDWEIDPEKALGAGNKMLQIAQTDKLMAARSAMDPDAQREVLHIFVETNTDDPQLANRLVPMKKPEVNDAILEAQWASGTLMQGLPVALKQGINHMDYVEAMLAAMTVVIQQIETATGGMATPQQVYGLKNMASHVQQHIAIIAQDESEKTRVKGYIDALGNMMNRVKGYEQRLAEQAKQASESSGGMSAEDIAKIKNSQIVAATQMKLKESSHDQKQAQKEESFKSEQERKDAQMDADIKRQDLQHAFDLATQAASQELANQTVEP